MVIRHATLEDVPPLVAMAMTFGASSEYAVHLALSEAHIRALIERAITDDTRLALVAEGRDGQLVGMLVLVAVEHPMSGELVASELAWWVNPTARGGRAAFRLLAEAEQWAKARGAVAMQMVAPNARVEALYEAVGYVPVERAYQRRF